MIDYFNLVLGITNLLITFITLYVIIKKYRISSFIFFGWVGLFVYTIPIYINFTREMYLIGDQARIFSNPSFGIKISILFILDRFFIKHNFIKR